MIACFYLSKALEIHRIQASRHISSIVTLLNRITNLLELRVLVSNPLPSSLLLFPPFSGSFPLLLNQTLALSGNWFLGTLLFRSNDSSRGHRRCSSGPLSFNSHSDLGQRFAFAFYLFFFLPSLQRKNTWALFLSLQRRHPSCCIRVCLLENEMPNKSVLEHHLMGKVMYWRRTTLLAFSRKPNLQQWLGNLPKPHTNILFPDGLPSTLCSTDILMHFWWRKFGVRDSGKIQFHSELGF